MELPINDKDLSTIVSALALGGDARLYHLLKEVNQVRDENPGVHYKKILINNDTRSDVGCIPFHAAATPYAKKPICMCCDHQVLKQT